MDSTEGNQYWKTTVSRPNRTYMNIKTTTTKMIWDHFHVFRLLVCDAMLIKRMKKKALFIGYWIYSDVINCFIGKGRGYFSFFSPTSHNFTHISKGLWNHSFAQSINRSSLIKCNFFFSALPPFPPSVHVETKLIKGKSIGHFFFTQHDNKCWKVMYTDTLLYRQCAIHWN